MFSGGNKKYSYYHAAIISYCSQNIYEITKKSITPISNNSPKHIFLAIKIMEFAFLESYPSNKTGHFTQNKVELS